MSRWHAFFATGLVKGYLLGDGRLTAAIETVIAGSIAATIAWVVGYLLRGLPGIG